MHIGEALKSFESEMEVRKREAKERKLQHTWRQQKAIEACDKIGEKNYGMFLRLYKTYDVARLDACVEWALRKDNPAMAFTGAWRKFVNPTRP
jgi:hypothetical protein